MFRIIAYFVIEENKIYFPVPLIHEIWYTENSSCPLPSVGSTMINEITQKLINSSLGALQNPVRLVVFTGDAEPERSREMLDLAKAIKAHSPKIALETYDIVMDRDKTRQYGVKLIPSLVIEDGRGRTVAFSGVLRSVVLETLLTSINALSAGKVWFPDGVRSTLKQLEHEVPVRVFVEHDCARCRPVAETAIGLALESAFIDTEIIVAGNFPELVDTYRIESLPKTLFGENLHMDGHVNESEFLEMIFQAEGLKASSPGRRCVVCGTPSGDLICAGCKSRIQAEAVEHKRDTEKFKQAGTVVKPRQKA